ncbi:MAG: ATP-binding protein [Hyphomonadaceae bacterium]
MDHFEIIQALCRSGLPNGGTVFRRQVERLRDALAAAGDQKAAASIGGLLNAAERTKEVAPSRLTASRRPFGGETLTPAAPPPVDRETGAALASIIFPNDIADDAPLFTSSITAALESLIEEWRHVQQLEEINVRPAKSCLIYGPPGAGKTRLAYWIAKRTGLPIISARIDGLVSSFLGTTARNIAALFTFANRYQAILLLDEFDAVAKVRDDPHEVGEIKRVVNTLLQNLDMRENVGVTIGITNHSALLDPAVWRRFDVQLEVPRPDFETRLAIARRYMEPMSVPDSHLRFIAWLTDHATGAEVEASVRAYKKSHAVNSNIRAVADIFRQFAVLNAGRIIDERRQLLEGPDAQLEAALQRDPDLSFSTRDAGEVTGVNKSTVSRRSSRAGAARKKSVG